MSPSEFLSALHFLRPLWLLALPLAVLPWLLAARDGRIDSPWSRWVDADLLPYLLADRSEKRRRRQGLAMGLLIALSLLALAGPAFRLAPQAEVIREAGLVIALDLSDGMRAADVPPDRLSRARFEIADVLRQRGDGQTALVAYAGEAFTVAPLTDDAATLESLLTALEPEVMPVSGQRPERALELAGQLLANAGLSGGDVLLVSYAGSEQAIPVAADLASRGVRTSLLVIGTDAGAPVPGRDGGFRAGEGGQLVLAGRDMASARALAAAGGGVVLEADANESDTRRLVEFWEQAEDGVRERSDEGSLRYVDEGPWLALLALLPALLVLRGDLRSRGAGMLALALLGAQSTPASAQDGWWDRLWTRQDQQAWRALEAGDAATARSLATTPELDGAAAFREGDFAAAAEAYDKGANAQSRYNRGTALARAGRLEEALGELQSALEMDPSLEDARHNRDVVQSALEQQQASQSDASEQDEGQEGEPTEDSGEGDPTEQEREGGQPGEPGQEGKPQDRDAGEGESSDTQADAAADDAAAREQLAEAQRQAMEEALSEQQQNEATAEVPAPSSEQIEAQEQQQASEQLLRKIPDDPGALLRRKFALEHRRRVLEGGGQ